MNGSKAVMHGKMHLQCQYCPKRFSMKHNLEHHIKDRHIKPHKCNICEKGFGSEWMLEKHKNVTHLGQRYTYRVLQTIQLKLILLCVWAELAVLGSTRTAIKFKYEI
jgi:NAD-dependent SIR2 family protein deacetylase